MKTSLSLGLLSSCLAAQSTWIVDCAGRPGTHFTDIPPAVAAAQPGDTIILLAHSSCTSTNYPYHPTVIDKPLRLIGATEFGSPQVGGMANVFGRIEVRNIPAGQEVLLCNLSVAPRQASAPPNYPYPSGIVLQNCAGKVHIEHVDYSPVFFANGLLSIEDCADVSVHWSTWYKPGDSIIIRRSNVAFTDCTLWPVYPYVPYGWGDPLFWMTTTADTLYLEAGTLRLTDCVVNASASYGFSPDRQKAYVASGTLLVGSNTWLPGDYWAPSVVNHGTTVVDPRGGVGFFHLQSTGIVRHEPIGSVNMEPVIRNQPFRATITGPPNGFALLAIGTSLHQPVPFPFGNLMVDPLDLMVAGCVSLDAQGFREFQFYAWSGAPMDHIYAFQAATLSPSGVLDLTWPAVFSVRWEGGHTWP